VLSHVVSSEPWAGVPCVYVTSFFQDTSKRRTKRDPETGQPA
jgi:hypothetical protein